MCIMSLHPYLPVLTTFFILIFVRKFLFSTIVYCFTKVKFVSFMYLKTDKLSTLLHVGLMKQDSKTNNKRYQEFFIKQLPNILKIVTVYCTFFV